VTERLTANDEGISRAADLLRGGGLVAFPTDTVYGVACSWDRPDRLPALFDLKRRPVEKRIPVLVASLEEAVAAGWAADDRAHRLSARFWPGPLTLVLPSAGLGESQAFRAPDHPVALALIQAAGPLLATSANLSGEPETLDAAEVLVAFATQSEGLDAVIDGGHVPGGVASTVLDLTVTPARVVREGPIPREDLAEVVEIE
jgi:L-threonylcarbamoyladenylate synthase